MSMSEAKAELDFANLKRETVLHEATLGGSLEVPTLITRRIARGANTSYQVDRSRCQY